MDGVPTELLVVDGVVEVVDVPEFMQPPPAEEAANPLDVPFWAEKPRDARAELPKLGRGAETLNLGVAAARAAEAEAPLAAPAGHRAPGEAAKRELALATTDAVNKNRTMTLFLSKAVAPAFASSSISLSIARRIVHRIVWLVFRLVFFDSPAWLAIRWQNAGIRIEKAFASARPLPTTCERQIAEQRRAIMQSPRPPASGIGIVRRVR